MPIPDSWARLSAAGNAGSLACLLAGWWLIRHGRVRAHRRAMLGALLCSAIFLLAYLMHHWRAGLVRYHGAGWARAVYFTVLATHTPLAALIPPLALFTFSLAARRRFRRHRRWARWTLPIWLYVSTSGLVIYFMLYRGW